MINRSLIRLKVVQMLYSYLLTGNEFRVLSMPLGLAKDKAYTYRLYIDLLLMIEELAGLSVSNAGRPSPIQTVASKILSSGQLVKALAADDTLRETILKNNSQIAAFDPLMPALYEELKASAAFADYSKLKERTIAEEARFWKTIIATTVLKNPTVQAILLQREGHTVSGTEQALEMLDKTLDSSSQSSLSLVNARNDLQRSLDKAYELYISLFQLIIQLTDLQRQSLEEAKAKHLATAEDLNPNTRLIDNQLVRRLREDPQLHKLVEDRAITWTDDPVLMRSLLDELLASDVYHHYIEAKDTDYEKDCDFWRTALKDVIFPSEALAEAMEGRSVYWNDDLHIMGTFVLKTIRQMGFDPDGAKAITMLPQYKDEEDGEFGDQLFNLAVCNRQLYRSYIDASFKTDRWDADRLAFMDIVIMICAIAELINYIAVPTAVIMNEYVEIANDYSTERSGQFINGLLFSVLNHLKDINVVPRERP